MTQSSQIPQNSETPAPKTPDPKAPKPAPRPKPIYPRKPLRPSPQPSPEKPESLESPKNPEAPTPSQAESATSPPEPSTPPPKPTKPEAPKAPDLPDVSEWIPRLQTVLRDRHRANAYAKLICTTVGCHLGVQTRVVQNSMIHRLVQEILSDDEFLGSFVAGILKAHPDLSSVILGRIVSVAVFGEALVRYSEIVRKGAN